MKLRQSLKFYAKEVAVSCAVFFGIMLALNITSMIIAYNLQDKDVNINMSNESSSFFFVFVWGIIVFVTYLKFFLQNGISRRTLFISGSISMVGVSVVLSAFNMILIMISEKFGGVNVSVYNTIYRGAGWSSSTAAVTNFSDFMAIFTWLAGLYLFFGFLGMVVGLAFYRLPKYGKVLLGITLGGGLLILLPTLEATVTKGAILRAVINFVIFISGINSPIGSYKCAISSVIMSMVLGVFAFLMLRKASPQKA